MTRNRRQHARATLVGARYSTKPACPRFRLPAAAEKRTASRRLRRRRGKGKCPPSSRWVTMDADAKRRVEATHSRRATTDAALLPPLRMPRSRGTEQPAPAATPAQHRMVTARASGLLHHADAMPSPTTKWSTGSRPSRYRRTRARPYAAKVIGKDSARTRLAQGQMAEQDSPRLSSADKAHGSAMGLSGRQSFTGLAAR